MEYTSNALKDLVKNPEGKRPLARLRRGGRILLKWMLQT
jgi:hypothetical protein